MKVLDAKPLPTLFHIFGETLSALVVKSSNIPGRLRRGDNSMIMMIDSRWYWSVTISSWWDVILDCCVPTLRMCHRWAEYQHIDKHKQHNTYKTQSCHIHIYDFLLQKLLPMTETMTGLSVRGGGLELLRTLWEVIGFTFAYRKHHLFHYSSVVLSHDDSSKYYYCSRSLVRVGSQGCTHWRNEHRVGGHLHDRTRDTESQKQGWGRTHPPEPNANCFSLFRQFSYWAFPTCHRGIQQVVVVVSVFHHAVPVLLYPCFPEPYTKSRILNFTHAAPHFRISKNSMGLITFSIKCFQKCLDELIIYYLQEVCMGVSR